MHRYAKRIKALAVVGGTLLIVFGQTSGWAQEANDDAPVDEAPSDVDELQQRLNNLSAVADRQLAAVNQRGDGIAELAEAVERLLALTGELRTDNANLLSERSTLSDELHRSRTESSALMEREDTLEEMLAKAEQLLDERTARVTSLESDLGDQSSRTAELERQLAEQAERVAGLESDLAALTEGAAQSEDALGTAAEELEGRDARIEELLGELTAALAQIAEQDREVEETRERLAALDDEIETLNERLGDSDQALAETTAAVAARDSRIASLESRLEVVQARRLEELENYRSEFFGRLRSVLGERSGVRVVGDRFVFQSDVLFGPGSDQLSDDAVSELSVLATTLQEIAREIPGDLPWLLRVDGHTDRRPINNERFPSNWDLSAARAIAVVNFLISRGVPGDRLAAAGLGEHHPIDDREDEIGSRRNRRIELRVTAQ